MRCKTRSDEQVNRTATCHLPITSSTWTSISTNAVAIKYTFSERITHFGHFDTRVCCSSWSIFNYLLDLTERRGQHSIFGNLSPCTSLPADNTRRIISPSESANGGKFGLPSFRLSLSLSSARLCYYFFPKQYHFHLLASTRHRTRHSLSFFHSFLPSLP